MEYFAFRICRKCKIQINYKTETGYLKAKELNTMCISCARRESIKKGKIKQGPHSDDIREMTAEDARAYTPISKEKIRKKADEVFERIQTKERNRIWKNLEKKNAY